MAGELDRFPVYDDLGSLGNCLFCQIVKIVLNPLVLHIIQLTNFQVDAYDLRHAVELSRLQDRCENVFSHLKLMHWAIL